MITLCLIIGFALSFLLGALCGQIDTMRESNKYVRHLKEHYNSVIDELR